MTIHSELRRRFGAPVSEQWVLGAQGMVHAYRPLSSRRSPAFLVHVVGGRLALFMGSRKTREEAQAALERLNALGMQEGYKAIMRRALWTWGDDGQGG